MYKTVTNYYSPLKRQTKNKTLHNGMKVNHYTLVFQARKSCDIYEKHKKYFKQKYSPHFKQLLQ